MVSRLASTQGLGAILSADSYLALAEKCDNLTAMEWDVDLNDDDDDDCSTTCGRLHGTVPYDCSLYSMCLETNNVATQVSSTRRAYTSAGLPRLPCVRMQRHSGPSDVDGKHCFVQPASILL